MATTPADILSELNIYKKKKIDNTVELSSDEKQIVTLIANNNSLHIDEIARNLQISVSTLSVQLSVLTMKGVLQEMDGGEYTIKT
jgi:predicted Rossmann fold nucleotide-binding protein DprA/Smf involved in DNA uptake